jgi:hypothetical protein
MMKQIVGASATIEVSESDFHSAFRRLSDRCTEQAKRTATDIVTIQFSPRAPRIKDKMTF